MSVPVDEARVTQLLAERTQAKMAGDFKKADGIRDMMKSEMNINIHDQHRTWSVVGDGGVGQKRKRPEFASDARAWVHDSCWFCMASPQFGAQLRT